MQASEILRNQTLQQFADLLPWDISDTENTDWKTTLSLHSSQGVSILRATLEDVNGLTFEEFEWELREK
jgi:hypothetical protein